MASRLSKQVLDVMIHPTDDPLNEVEGMKKFVRRCTVAALALPAQAALYLYADSGYRAQIGKFTSAMRSPHNISPGNNDSLSSFKNQTAFSVAFWHDANGKGSCFTGKPYSNAAWFVFWDDNKVSSFQLGRAC